MVIKRQNQSGKIDDTKTTKSQRIKLVSTLERLLFKAQLLRTKWVGSDDTRRKGLFYLPMVCLNRDLQLWCILFGQTRIKL